MPVEIPNHLLPKIQRIIKIQRDRYGFETTPAEFFEGLTDGTQSEGYALFAAEFSRKGFDLDVSIEGIVNCILLAEEDMLRHPG